MILGYRRKGTRLSVLAGLSAGNLERLMAGEPMNISRETHGEGCPEELVLRIVSGRTEDETHAQMIRAGLSRPGKTQSHDYRR